MLLFSLFALLHYYVAAMLAYAAAIHAIAADLLPPAIAATPLLAMPCWRRLFYARLMPLRHFALLCRAALMRCAPPIFQMRRR